VNTTVDEIHPPDPSAPLERIFNDAFPITVSPISFAGDGNGGQDRRPSDVIFDLDYLFVGGATPVARRGGRERRRQGDISDPLGSCQPFGQSEPLRPRALACGPDADTDDTLAACVYSC